MTVCEPSNADIVSTNERKVSTIVDNSRLPALDGVRAIAVTLVLISHALFHWRAPWLLAVFVGQAGVSIFLVLSGFLVTRAMLLDEQKSGRLRLGRFYRRRALRIFPAFYGFLIGLALLSALGLIAHPDRASWLASLLYVRNWTIGEWNTGHLWSLSLEDQFYLIWPAVFLLLRTNRRRLVFVAQTIITLTAWREYWLAHNGVHAALRTLDFRTDMRFDTFLIGAAVILRDWNWTSKLVPRYVLTALLIWYVTALLSSWTLAVDTVVTAVGIGALLLWLVQNPQLGPARFLSRRSLVFAGQISYRVYLWQQPFLGPPRPSVERAT